MHITKTIAITTLIAGIATNSLGAQGDQPEIARIDLLLDHAMRRSGEEEFIKFVIYLGKQYFDENCPGSLVGDGDAQQVDVDHLIADFQAASNPVLLSLARMEAMGQIRSWKAVPFHILAEATPSAILRLALIHPSRIGEMRLAEEISGRGGPPRDGIEIEMDLLSHWLVLSNHRLSTAYYQIVEPDVLGLRGDDFVPPDLTFAQMRRIGEIVFRANDYTVFYLDDPEVAEHYVRSIHSIYPQPLNVTLLSINPVIGQDAGFYAMKYRLEFAIGFDIEKFEELYDLYDVQRDGNRFVVFYCTPLEASRISEGLASLAALDISVVENSIAAVTPKGDISDAYRLTIKPVCDHHPIDKYHVTYSVIGPLSDLVQLDSFPPVE